MFGKDAPDSAQEMIDQRKGISDEKGLKFSKRVQSDVRRMLDEESHRTTH